jgi:hypothetical protein
MEPSVPQKPCIAIRRIVQRRSKHSSIHCSLPGAQAVLNVRMRDRNSKFAQHSKKPAAE